MRQSWAKWNRQRQACLLVDALGKASIYGGEHAPDAEEPWKTQASQ
jgi:hypothetical protein